MAGSTPSAAGTGTGAGAGATERDRSATPAGRSGQDGHGRISWTGPRIVGLVLLALGVLALIATFDTPSAHDGWAIQGPRFAPLIASLALILFAMCFLVRTIIRPDVEVARYAAAEADSTHWPTPAALLGLLVGYALLLTALGYALATTIFVG
jgi:uncharacterized membrane protein HdeD (DUF308 family)